MSKQESNERRTASTDAILIMTQQKDTQEASPEAARIINHILKQLSGTSFQDAIKIFNTFLYNKRERK